ncbi:hypothetical protein BDZ45DRAFT_229440 [Acephala macrosclerotiorum]|nr:hypothetical protein BDZ45DRAFT_229440 [Acephala macrosclerotiorum]
MGMIQTVMLDSRIHEKWQNEIRAQLLLPSIEESITSNTRWMRIFAGKHKISLNEFKAPMLPVDPSILEDAIGDKLGSSLFRLFQNYLFISLDPPEQMREFLRSLDQKAIKEPPCNHFIHLYGCFQSLKHLKGHPFIYQEKRRTTHQDFKYPSSLTYLQRLVYKILDWKEDDSEAKVQGSIQRNEIEDYLFKHAQVLLQKYPHSYAFGDLMKAFKRPWGKDEKRWNFPGPGRAFLERVSAYIDSLRTPEWQRNQHKMPVILPSTFQDRLWLQPYPTFHNKLPPYPNSQVKEQEEQEAQEILAWQTRLKNSS